MSKPTPKMTPSQQTLIRPQLSAPGQQTRAASASAQSRANVASQPAEILPSTLEIICNRLRDEMTNMEPPKGLQAVINLLHYEVGLKLPESLSQFIDDPKYYPDQQQRFASVSQYTDQLVRHYTNEAVAKEALAECRRLGISPDDLVSRKIHYIILQLFHARNVAQQNKLVKHLKVTTLRARLRSFLPSIGIKSDSHKLSELDLKRFEQLAVDLVEADTPSQQMLTCLIEALKMHGISLDPTASRHLQQVCTSFPAILAADDPDAVQQRIIDSVLTTLNGAFSQEIVILNDLPVAFFSGQERLFRGLRGAAIKSEAVAATFQFTHRSIPSSDHASHRLDPLNLFSFQPCNHWSQRARSGWVEGLGAFASFRAYRAFTWGSHCTLEIVPKPGKMVYFGKSSECEVMLDQVEPDEIAAIYVSDFRSGEIKISAVFENPHFYGFAAKIRSHKYDVGSDVSFDDIGEDQAYRKCKKAPLDLNVRPRYPDYDDFAASYDQTSLQARRAQLKLQRGAPSAREQFHAPRDTIAQLYQQFTDCLASANPADAKAQLAKCAETVDGQGHDVAALAVVKGDLDTLRQLIAWGHSLTRTNFHDQNLLHLAVRHHRYDIIDLLVFHGVASDARDIEGLTPLDEALRDEDAQALEALELAGVRLARPKVGRFAEEMLETPVFALARFAPQKLLDLCYGFGVFDASSLDRDRLAFLCSPQAFHAVEKNYLKISELRSSDIVALKAVCAELTRPQFALISDTWSAQYREYEQRADKACIVRNMDQNLLDLSVALRSLVMSKPCKEVLALTGETTKDLVHFTPEHLRPLLKGPVMKKFFNSGMKLTDFVQLSAAKTELLVATCRGLFELGIRVTDLGHLRDEVLLALADSHTVECLRRADDKLAMVNRLVAGDVKDNTLEVLLEMKFPEHLEDLNRMSPTKRKLLATQSGKMGALPGFHSLVEFAPDQLALIARSNFHLFVEQSGLSLSDFVGYRVGILKHFCGFDDFPLPPSNNELIRQLGTGDTASVPERIEAGFYTIEELRFIISWAQASEHAGIVSLAKTMIDTLQCGAAIRADESSHKPRGGWLATLRRRFKRT